MKLRIEVEATPNEKRRLLGGADVTPMIELVSAMLDDVMMVVVEARLAALEQAEAWPISEEGPLDGKRTPKKRRALS